MSVLVTMVTLSQRPHLPRSTSLVFLKDVASIEDYAVVV